MHNSLILIVYNKTCPKIPLAYKLASNRAFYNKACCDKYNQSHLKRLKTDSESSAPTLGRTLSSQRSVSAINFVDKCFFWDKKDSDEILHECQTLCLDAFVRKIALEMQNSKLISKLSEGDMVATEAKYHRQCFLKLYNNYHNFNKFLLKDLKSMYEKVLITKQLQYTIQRMST